jgi:REP element-mobilizing transposase RayT
MPRKAREKILYGTYLITQTSGADQPLFRDDQDRTAFLAIVKKVKEKFDFHLYGYCLRADNGYRLLIYDNGSDLSKIMKALNIRYAMYAKCEGKIYKDRYKSQLIQDYRELIESAVSVYGKDEHCAWSQFSVLLQGERLSELLDPIPNQDTYRPYLTEAKESNQVCDRTMPLCERGGTCHRTRKEVEVALGQQAKEQGTTVEAMISEKEVRNEMIRRIRKESTLSLRAIGEIFGLSESAVCKIINC